MVVVGCPVPTGRSSIQHIDVEYDKECVHPASYTVALTTRFSGFTGLHDTSEKYARTHAHNFVFKVKTEMSLIPVTLIH